MTIQKTPLERASGRQNSFNRLGASGIGASIIVPYLLLALAMGGVGAFVVTKAVPEDLVAGDREALANWSHSSLLTAILMLWSYWTSTVLRSMAGSVRRVGAMISAKNARAPTSPS